MKRLGPFRLTREAVSRHYDIHSWLGILGGIAFFVCCFSGSLALFERDLVAWERPAVRPTADSGGPMLSIDALLDRARQHVGTEKDMFVTLPTESVGALQVRAFADGEVDEVTLDPHTGRVIEVPESATAFGFLTHLHTDLHLPRPLGRYLVGFLGIFMVMSLVTGILTHTKVMKDLFLLRWRPRLRLTFSDLHKQVGVWGLAFGLVMALTGAVIGLLNLFAPIMVLSAFGGNVEKAIEAYSGPHFEETGIQVEMLSVDSLLASAQENHPDFRIESFSLGHWGDETAEVTFFLQPHPYRHLLAGESHRLSLVDGRLLYVSTFGERGLGARLFGTVQPLHYALFGGLPLKLLYLISGFALSFGILSGSVIWLKRRQNAEGKDNYFWIGRLHLGICMGLVVASALAIGAGRLAPAVLEPLFWGSWLAITLGAFWVPDGFAAIRTGGFATALILGAVATYDLLASPVLTEAARNVDLVLLVLGALTAAIASISPRRPQGGRTSEADDPKMDRPGVDKTVTVPGT